MGDLFRALSYGHDTSLDFALDKLCSIQIDRMEKTLKEVLLYFRCNVLVLSDPIRI